MIQQLLYAKSIPINDKISVYIPTVDEVLIDEEHYYSLIAAFTAMPIDFMVQLDEAKIDFTTINEYELFLLLFQGLKSQDTHLVLGDLDLSKFEVAVNAQNEAIVLVDREHDITIDRSIHRKIATALRQIHHLKQDKRTPANDAAKEYLIQRARDKMKRRKNRIEDSQLEELIVAMVNTEQYKYDYESTRGLSIYQFNQSVRQIIKKIDYEHTMAGVYAGTIDAKGLSQDDLNWLSNK